MPKWKKDAKEFVVGVYVGNPHIKINIPKPIYELLSKPRKLKFIIKGNKIVVEGA